MQCLKSTGMVAHWPMSDHAASTAVVDTSRGGLNGVFTDATGDPNTDAHTVAGPTGQANSALSFDGVDDYINLGTTISALVTNDHSISIWANVASGSDGFIWSGAAGGATRYYLNFNGTILQARISDTSDVDAVDYDYTSHFDKWTNIVVTLKGLTCFMYVNGVFIVSGTGTAISWPVDNLSVGSDSGNTAPCTMSASDMIVFDRALTYPMIRKLWHAGGGV